MAGKCSKEHCYPDDTGCNYEACVDVRECIHYNKPNTDDILSKEVANAVGYYKFPWTGNTFGLDDLKIVSARSRISIIGIAGATKAGKTTFLGSLFCLLRHGFKLSDYDFSGSYTLTGWENISYPLSFNSGHVIEFPTHTTSNQGRVPGMLHLALKSENGMLRDILFTDAPGEWFEHWTINKNDINAQGAEWIHQNADAFLLFPDIKQLQGNESGKTRLKLRQVSDRIKNTIKGRPLGLVWAKSDLLIAPELKKAITNDIFKNAQTSTNEFDVSVKPGIDNQWHNNIIATLNWLLSELDEPNYLREIGIVKSFLF